MVRLFGTSGARGDTNKDITPELALRIGTAFGNLLEADCEELVTVAVAHDNRYGAEMLAQAVTVGLTSAGAFVYFLGCVPTGVMSVFMGPNGNRGGMLVTGSHMPPERIGIIPLRANGHYHDRDMTDGIEAILRSWPDGTRRVNPNRLGLITVVPQKVSADVYYETVLKHVDALAIKNLNPRVLFDSANETVGDVAKNVLNWLGCAMHPINLTPKPIPDRPSECRTETCGVAISQTAAFRCDLGVCFDGDADRVLFITPQGVALPDSVVGAIFARHYVQEGQVIVTPVNASGLIEVIAAERKAAPVVYCRIGQPSTDTKIRAHGAAFAYEEAAGKFGFRELECCYDGPFAVLKMLEIMATTGKTIDELAREIPKFFQKSVKIPVPDAMKEAVVPLAVRKLRQALRGQIRNEDTTDGTKFFLNDVSYALLRASGTEAFVRIYTDTQVNQTRADALAELGVTCLNEAIAEVR